MTKRKYVGRAFRKGRRKRVFLLKVLHQVYLRYTCEAVSFQRETAHVGNTPKTRIFRGIWRFSFYTQPQNEPQMSATSQLMEIEK